jgi:hypothetical protein
VDCGHGMSHDRNRMTKRSTEQNERPRKHQPFGSHPEFPQPIRSRAGPPAQVGSDVSARTERAAVRALVICSGDSMTAASRELQTCATARSQIRNHCPAIEVDVQMLAGRSHWVYVITANGGSPSELQHFLEQRLARPTPPSGKSFLVYGDEIQRLAIPGAGQQAQYASPGD